MTVKQWVEEIWVKQKGKSKAELARELGVTWAYMWKIMNGHVKCPKAPIVAKLIQLAEGYLTLDDICQY